METAAVVAEGDSNPRGEASGDSVPAVVTVRGIGSLVIMGLVGSWGTVGEALVGVGAGVKIPPRGRTKKSTVKHSCDKKQERYRVTESSVKDGNIVNMVQYLKAKKQQKDPGESERHSSKLALWEKKKRQTQGSIVLEGENWTMIQA